MSIDDPLILHEHPNQGLFWKQGRETFYDEDDIWITFETLDEALEWVLADEPFPLPRENIVYSS